VAAASLNMHDLWTLRGVGIKPDQFPMILGCDVAGRLADGTEVVLSPVIGDPDVAGDETLDPKRTLLTEKAQGTFATWWWCRRATSSPSRPSCRWHRPL
jgi:NADPH:quinone reductase-like Zn-dependent oxidoreductase